MGWLGEAYLWVKALHVSFVIFWMAGLFMIPRYLVYWHPVAPGAPEALLWDERTRRLRRIILTPAMIIVWLAGLALAFNSGWPLWLQLKFIFVVALTWYHRWMVVTSKRFARGERPQSERTLRLLNEVPSLTTFAITILVIVQPFG